MSINLSVRDFRGIERADVRLDHIALVAGKNEQGKSSLAQAARAVLAGVPIPFPGINKKDAHILVRDGGKEGYAKISDAEEVCVVSWPKADITGDSDGRAWATEYAVGLKHIFDMPERERAIALAEYIHSNVQKKDLAAALKDAGFGEEAIDRVWDSVNGQHGWDGTYKRAREHTTNLKGQWEATTGEKYGSKKAENWRPADCGDIDLEKTTLGALETDLERARERVKELVGQAAVSDSQIEQLRQQASQSAEDAEGLEHERDVLQKKLDTLMEEIESLPPAPDQVEPVDCPKCGTALVISGRSLTVHQPDNTSQSDIERRHDLEEKARDIRSAVFDLEGRICQATKHREQIQAARERLAEIEAKPKIDQDAVQEAEDHERKLRHALAASASITRASSIHESITKNGRLIDILSPEGLRRRRLVEGLEVFNRALSDLCTAAKWQRVYLDENLSPHYGDRPVWAASGSGQWRARTIVQIAMALMDDSAAVVIDEADILDTINRNRLFQMLKHANIQALVCMTINKPDLVPNLEAAGMGHSFWVEKGISTELGRE